MLVRDAQDQQKQDPRILRTRKLLTQALGEMLREKSFQAITVGEITERATLNRVTFYAHFQDKFDLLEYASREMIREQINSQLPDAATYSEENLKELIALVGRFLNEMDRCPPPHGQMQPLMEKQIKNELYDLLLGWLNARATQRKASAPSAEQAAMVASWAIYGAALQWSRQAQAAPIHDFVRQVLPLITPNLESFVEEPAPRPNERRVGGGGFAIPQLRLQMRSI